MEQKVFVRWNGVERWIILDICVQKSDGRFSFPVEENDVIEILEVRE